MEQREGWRRALQSFQERQEKRKLEALDGAR